MPTVALRRYDPSAVSVLWESSLPALNELHNVKARIDGGRNIRTGAARESDVARLVDVYHVRVAIPRVCIWRSARQQ